jgi:hypothetical protein
VNAPLEAAAFEAAEKRGGVGCKTCDFLLTLPPATVAMFDAEFRKPVAVRSSGAIHRVMETMGAVVVVSSVKRHRSQHVRPV